MRAPRRPGGPLGAPPREAAGRGDDPGAESPADAALDGAQAQLDTLRMHVAALLHEIDEGAYRLRVVGAAVRAVARAPDLVELGEAIAMCREASGLLAGYESEAKSGDES